MNEVAETGNSTVVTLELVKPGNNENGQPVQAKFKCSKNLSAPRQLATILLLILFSFSTLVALLKSIYEENTLRNNAKLQDLLPSFDNLNYTLVMNDTVKVFALQ